MTYKERCKEAHRKRCEVASSVFDKLLSNCSHNRKRDQSSDFPTLTDREISIAFEAIQYYMQNTCHGRR